MIFWLTLFMLSIPIDVKKMSANFRKKKKKRKEKQYSDFLLFENV